MEEQQLLLVFTLEANQTKTFLLGPPNSNSRFLKIIILCEEEEEEEEEASLTFAELHWNRIDFFFQITAAVVFCHLKKWQQRLTPARNYPARNP